MGYARKQWVLVKECLKKLKEDNIQNKEMFIDWAINARNTLNMSNGYSPHQLGFGKNPYVPSNEKDEMNIQEEENESEMMRETLESLNKARERKIKIWIK